VNGVWVTGPPRSGTSATTRLLALAGLHLCVPEDRLGGGPNNPTGHWESKTVLAVNNRLLERAGARWWCPPPAGTDIGRGESSDDAAQAFRAVHRTEPWVCKDPRLSFTLPFWRAATGADAACVIVVRHPADVVASIRRTWPLSVEHAAALWTRYVVDAFAVTEGLPTAIARFPEIVDDPAELDALVARLRSFGVPIDTAPAADVAAFVQPVRGRDHRADGLPAYVWDTWEQLTKRAQSASPTRPHVDGAADAVIAALRDELAAGRPLDVRAVFGPRGR